MLTGQKWPLNSQLAWAQVLKGDGDCSKLTVTFETTWHFGAFTVIELAQIDVNGLWFLTLVQAKTRLDLCFLICKISILLDL